MSLTSDAFYDAVYPTGNPTKDTAYLQSLIDDAVNTGGLVEIPPGLWRINRGLKFQWTSATRNPAMHIKGAGIGQTEIVNESDDFAFTFWPQGGTAISVTEPDGSDNVVMKVTSGDLTESMVGAKIDVCSFTFENNNRRGNNYFTVSAVDIANQTITFDNSQALTYAETNFGEWSMQWYAFDLEISHMTIRAPEYNASDECGGIHARTYFGLYIHDIRFLELGREGIYINHTGLDANVPAQTHIRHCRFEFCGNPDRNGPSDGRAGVRIGNYRDVGIGGFIQIVDNFFDTCGFGLTGGWAGPSLIQLNTFAYTTLGPGLELSATIGHPYHPSIIDNGFEGNVKGDCWLKNSYGGYFARNRFIGTFRTGTTPTESYGLRIGMPVSGINANITLVSGNIFKLEDAEQKGLFSNFLMGANFTVTDASNTGNEGTFTPYRVLGPYELEFENASGVTESGTVDFTLSTNQDCFNIYASHNHITYDPDGMDFYAAFWLDNTSRNARIDGTFNQLFDSRFVEYLDVTDAFYPNAHTLIQDSQGYYYSNIPKTYSTTVSGTDYYFDIFQGAWHNVTCYASGTYTFYLPSQASTNAGEMLFSDGRQIFLRVANLSGGLMDITYNNAEMASNMTLSTSQAVVMEFRYDFNSADWIEWNYKIL